MTGGQDHSIGLRSMLGIVLSAVFLCVAVSPALAQQDEKALATAIQLELNRLGCEAGTPDGIWGGGSKRALGRYATKAAETLDDQPTEQLLSKLRSENGRLCTLPPGVVAADDRSDTAHLEAVRYSYKIWSTLPARVASEMTEYGTLRCVAGKNGGPRSCVWQ